MHSAKCLLLSLGLTIGLHPVVSAAPTEEQAHFFESHIRPLLARTCLECHGPNKAESDVRLDSRAGVLSLVVAGKPEDSRLWQVLQYHDDDTQMPPTGKLAADKLALVEAWLKMGAPWPDSVKPPSASDSWNERVKEAQDQHWAFQPITRPSVPRANADWDRSNAIDAFVHNRLAAASLTPSAPADSRTILRRLYYDLVGLPPSFQEHQAFAVHYAKAPQQAVAQVVDRLLASPQYGERWGRHWLDIARYADTQGYLNDGQDTRYPHAYTYRDYVIDAFNSDKPFDRFLREQLAADQLDLQGDREALAALGFITTGRIFLSQHDTIDDRIDVVARGLLGLTVTCARCHDHKFDPIGMADYYGLYGVMASSDVPEELPVIAEPPMTAAYEGYLSGVAKREQDLVNLATKVRQDVLDEFRTETAAYLKGVARSAYPKHRQSGDTRMTNGQEVRRGGVTRWTEALKARRQAKDEFVALWFRAAETDPGQLGSLFNQFATAKSVNGLPPGDRYPTLRDGVRDLHPTDLAGLADVYAVVLRRVGEAVAGQGNAQPSEPERTAWQHLFADAASPLALTYDGEPKLMFDWLANQQMVTREDRTKEKRIQSDMRKWQADNAAAPPRAMVLQDRDRPMSPQIFKRGDPGQRGDRVPRRFLQVLSFVDGGKPFSEKASGRLELANAIASPANPLTARVMVNRVWLRHFGQGLVATSSNFGLQAKPPTHPELLDWLAAEFIDSGWSLKHLHRLILTSATWQQTSEYRADAFNADPDNQWIWRQNRRRLEWEPMRDTLLHVAGQLDASMGGRSVDLFKTPAAPRRAVYGFVDRQDVAGALRVFDFTNADATTDQRPYTTIPQQALFMLNSPFVLEQANRLANHPAFASLPNSAYADRIDALYRIALSRQPTATELALMQAYLRDHKEAPPNKNSLTAWQQVCLATLMANEMLFVD